MQSFEQFGGNGIFISPDYDMIHALLFADDVASMSDTALHLQKKISAVEKFCEATGMKVNVGKTKVIVCRNSGPLRQYEKWSLFGQELEVVPFYRY